MKKLLPKLSILLVVVFLGTVFFSYGCGLFFNLDTLRYEEYDFSEIEKAVTSADVILDKYKNLSEEDVKTASGAEKLVIITTALSKMNTSFYKLVDTYRLANLYYNKDTTSEYYKTQYSLMSSAYNTWYAKFMAVHNKAVNLPCAMEIFQDEDYINDMKKRTEETSNPRYSELTEQIDTLGNEYISNYYNEMTRAELADRREEIAGILLNMAAAGKEFAETLGYDSYKQYMYEVKYERKYSPSDSLRMAGYVKEYLSPLMRELKNALTNTAKSASFLSANQSIFDRMTKVKKIGDSYYSVYNGKRLTEYPEYDSYFKQYFNEIGGGMPDSYSVMKSCNLYQAAGITDLNDTSFSGSYTGRFAYYGYPKTYPYIYQHYDLSYSSVPVTNITSFIHEFGHFNAYYTDSPSSSSLDIAEIHSQGNEALFLPMFAKMFDKDTYDYFSTYFTLNQIGYAIVMGCYMDEFQQYVYDNYEELTPADVCRYASSLAQSYRLGDLMDSGADTFWTRVPHTFESPFYYISYAASSVPSLQLYEMSLTDRAGAINAYNSIVTEDKPFEALLTYAGLTSPFELQTYADLRVMCFGRLVALM